MTPTLKKKLKIVRDHFSEGYPEIKFRFGGPIKDGYSLKPGLGFLHREDAEKRAAELMDIAESCPVEVDIRVTTSRDFRGGKSYNVAVRVHEKKGLRTS